MSFNGSYTATLSPTASESFSGHLLSSSISSLSSSTSSRHSSSSTSKIYRQASTLFLTRRLPEALSTLLPLITPPTPDAANGTNGVDGANGTNGAAEPAPVSRASRTTRIRVWSLYLTILNAIVELEPEEGKEAFGAQEWRAICAKVRDSDVWEEVVQNGYHGVEGEVDSEVVINLATLLLAHAKTQTLNQKRLESYLAASQTPKLDLSNRFELPPSPRRQHASSRHRSPAKASAAASGADTPRDLNARVKILELYTLHVLLRNNEWDYAREFISFSSVLDEERREAFLQALQSLQEEQQEAERHEREEKQRHEEQLRRDLEEARRLRAENEERERRRIEEERARREGSEVDYGIEKTPSIGGGSSRGSAPRPSRGGLSSRASTSGQQPSLPPKTQAKGKAAAGPVAKPASFGARAAIIISNLRALIEGMGISLRSNPMVLARTLAFVIGLLLMFGHRGIRARISRTLGKGWEKVRATAGMGVKVSYI